MCATITIVNFGALHPPHILELSSPSPPIALTQLYATTNVLSVSILDFHMKAVM